MKSFKDLLTSRRGRKSKESTGAGIGETSRLKSSSPPVMISPSTILMFSTPRLSPLTLPVPSPSPQPLDSILQLRVQALEKENAKLRAEASIHDEDFKRLQRSYNDLFRRKSPAPQRRVRKQPSKPKISVYKDPKPNSKVSPSFVSRIPVRVVPIRPALPSKLPPLRFNSAPTRHASPASTQFCTPSRGPTTPTPTSRLRAVSAKQSVSSIRPKSSMTSIRPKSSTPSMKAKLHLKRPVPLVSGRPNMPVMLTPPPDKATRRIMHDSSCKGKENGLRPDWV